MRQSQKSNRPRNKNGRKPSGPSPNRVYESTGPEGKVRGTPQQIIDKYQSLARDKATSGDRIMSEAFLQHAEHYLRILSASQPARSDERTQDDRGADDRQSDERGDDRVDAGRDGGYGDAGGSGDLAASADGMAVIGDDEQGGPSIVETPENASAGRRRGRRPARRGPRSDEDGGSEDAPERSASRRQPSESDGAEQELALGDSEAVGETAIRAAE